jgi:hypothetical protein
LQITAENTADAYKRAMAKAADEAKAIKPAKKAARKTTDRSVP